MHSCTYPTIMATLSANINKPLLPKITPPTILYYPINRSIPYYLYRMIDLSISSTFKYPKRILLPPSCTYCSNHRTILQHTYYRSIISQVLRYPCLIWYHQQILSRTYPIAIRIRIIRKTTFERQTTLQCLINRILKIPSRTTTPCSAFQ
jgi:hypothetical protein